MVSNILLQMSVTIGYNGEHHIKRWNQAFNTYFVLIVTGKENDKEDGDNSSNCKAEFLPHLCDAEGSQFEM